MEWEMLPSRDEDNALVRSRLRAHNRRYMRGFRDYSFHIREGGETVAGIVAAGTGDTLEVEYLFVEEPHRGRGLGSRLLAHTEALARRDGLKRVLVNTYSFQAPGFYRQRGYKELFCIDPCFDGYRQHYYMKALAPPAQGKGE